jgi:acetylornithine deacetylase/succinyl-diaminopimelate desuccinylase-like protein
MVELLASLHSPQGVVTVAGFYDDVEALSAAERARIAAVPFDEAAYMAQLGIAAVFGEPGYSTLERTWVRPTLELNGLWGGFQGAGTKTVLPREAHAKITCRLVPHQDPFIVRDLVVAHLRAHQPPGVRLSVIPHGAVAWPYAVPWEHPVNQAAREVLAELYGREPFATRSGGSVPMCEILLRNLGAYAISFGFGLRDERAHAPDEFFRLASLARGQVATAKLLKRLARA